MSETISYKDGYRDLCILRTLYNTGARASELCGIRRVDLDLRGKQVLLHGKGRKDRTVPLWDSTATFLVTYLKSERRNPLPAFREFLFINQRRGTLTRSSLYSLCNYYLAQARAKAPSIERKRIHPIHVWRYTTASHLLLAGVDVTVIQDWLGHVSINTTCRYKGISVETKREALQKFYLFEKPGRNQSPKESTGASIQIFWRFLNRYSLILPPPVRPETLPINTKNVLSLFAGIA